VFGGTLCYRVALTAHEANDHPARAGVVASPTPPPGVNSI